jgi:hypothetical protein
MPSRPRTSSVVAFSVVSIVLPVSGFAQTDSRLQAVLLRSSETVARPYIAERDPSREISALPPNLIVADIYRPAVEMMRLRSATFRRQCARIASAPYLLVVVESELLPPHRHSLALTHIVRYEYGRMRATIRLAVPSRASELIAHELEHVLEQLDGVDLAAKARLSSSGVSACDCGDALTFETTRAVVTGLRVAHEVGRN